MGDLVLGLSEGIEAIRRGATTSVEWTRACLARIAALEPRVEAFAWLDPQLALARAASADRATGGALRGAPIAIKDVFDTKDIPTRMGSAAFADHTPRASAAIVQRLEDAGAFVLGKTVTAELAFYAPGKTRNPWSPLHTPGGSSSGSAAAVAAGFAPAALGTQTNGSVVRPAAYCGCIGFKPSFGRVPRGGVLEFSATLDHVGLFARSVHDATVLFGACADPNQHSAVPLGRAPRLTAVRSPVWDIAAPHAQEHFTRTLARLREAGASIEERELPPPFAGAHAVHRTIMFGEGARSFAALRQLHARVLSAPTLSMIDEGLGISEEQLSAARAERLRLRDALDEVVASTDALVTPPATGEAPDLLTTGNPRFCTIWTLCGVPALTLPSGRGPSGLPLGTQLIGRFGRDADLLEVARWCETALADRR